MRSAFHHAAILSLLLLSLPCTGMAQAHRWTVLYSGSSEPQSAQGQAIARLSSVFSRYGEVISPTNASGLFEGAYSRPVRAVTPDQESELAEALRAMDVQVGRNQRTAALRTAAHIQELIDRSFEAWLTRQELAARLFHTCLLVAGLRNHDDAIRHLDLCRMIDPVTVPDMALYPVEVGERLAEFDAEFRSRSTESLSVDADVSGLLLLDGRSVGPVPQTIPVRAGEHRVALDTGELSRYYRVLVSPGLPASLHIDAVLNRSVRSTGALSLVYSSDEQEQESRQAHGLLVARVLGVTDLLLATPTSADEIRVDRLTVDGAVHCSVVIRTGLSGREERLQYQRAAQALVTDQSINAATMAAADRWHPPEMQAVPAGDAAPVVNAVPDLPAAVVEAISPDLAPTEITHPTAPAAPRVRTQRVGALPIAMSAGGGALLLTSVGLLSYSVVAEARYGNLSSTERGFLDDQKQIALVRGLFTAFAISGSALLVSGMLWILPRGQRVPWWAWLSGGIGVAGLVPSIWGLAVADSCVDRYCLMHSEREWIGTTLLFYSLAAIAIPTIFLLRDRLRLDMAVIPSSASTSMLVWLRF